MYYLIYIQYIHLYLIYFTVIFEISYNCPSKFSIRRKITRFQKNHIFPRISHRCYTIENCPEYSNPRRQTNDTTHDPYSCDNLCPHSYPVSRASNIDVQLDNRLYHRHEVRFRGAKLYRKFYRSIHTYIYTHIKPGRFDENPLSPRTKRKTVGFRYIFLTISNPDSYRGRGGVATLSSARERSFVQPAD